MAYRDTEVDPIPQFPGAASLPAPPDWRRLYEQTLERAEAAESQVEELKSAELAARAKAGTYKALFKSARRKRLEAVEDANEARRVAKNAFSLRAEVRRLNNLLADAGVASHRSSVIGLRREIVRLREDVPRAEVQARKIRKLHKANWQLRVDKAALRRILNDAMRDYHVTRRLGDQQDKVRSLKDENLDLRHALKRSETVNEKLKVRLVHALETARSMSPAAADAELRKVLGQARRRKAGMTRLSKENARLRRTVRRLQRRTGTQETEIAKLRATRAVLSKALHGRRSERQDRPRTGRPRGHQRGVPGHGRTPRPGLEERVEERNPPAIARSCSGCGKPYVANGADESSLMEIEVQALREGGRSSRAWLWVSVSDDATCFHIDPSRSAEAAHKLLGGSKPATVIVCDRYSAYKKLAHLLGHTVILAWCWVHLRRDIIECAAGQPQLTRWCRRWLGRIASIYRLNKARLAQYDAAADRQSAAFDAAQGTLEITLDDLFAAAERELADLDEQAREGKPLRSLVNHREGLSVFIDRPEVPLDNNFAERVLRGPVIGRRLSFGSDSETGARLTALMYSVIGTLNLNGIDVLRWLEAWLTACAHNGGRPPDDLAPWLPWSMEPARRRELTAPG